MRWALNRGCDPAIRLAVWEAGKVQHGQVLLVTFWAADPESASPHSKHPGGPFLLIGLVVATKSCVDVFP
jgi:hypothetical protein